jgi:tetratricopeptide (TPR) repeat protein
MFTRGKQYIQAGLTVDGMQYLQTAIIQSPQEALFYDELATTYSLVAATIQAEDATTAAEIANAAIVTSDQALTLNPRHLNFYKSRARIFINLSILDPKYFEKAKETLDAAVLLAPTDAKLRYNLALVEQAMGRTDQARLVLEETVAMKTNYGAARLELARRYREAGQFDQARQQYQYLLTNINSNNPVVVQELEELEKTATSSAK